MTDQMKTMLHRAAGKIGVVGSVLTFEASRKGWVKCVGAPQNSTTLRYKITDEGREALNSAQ